MAYEITITEVVVESTFKGKEWNVVDQVLEVETGRMKNVYGHTPEIKKKVETVREVYKQRVSELDLNTVIMAINNIPIVRSEVRIQPLKPSKIILPEGMDE